MSDPSAEGTPTADNSSESDPSEDSPGNHGAEGTPTADNSSVSDPSEDSPGNHGAEGTPTADNSSVMIDASFNRHSMSSCEASVVTGSVVDISGRRSAPAVITPTRRASTSPTCGSSGTSTLQGSSAKKKPSINRMGDHEELGLAPQRLVRVSSGSFGSKARKGQSRISRSTSNPAVSTGEKISGSAKMKPWRSKGDVLENVHKETKGKKKKKKNYRKESYAKQSGQFVDGGTSAVLSPVNLKVERGRSVEWVNDDEVIKRITTALESRELAEDSGFNSCEVLDLHHVNDGLTMFPPVKRLRDKFGSEKEVQQNLNKVDGIHLNGNQLKTLGPEFYTWFSNLTELNLYSNLFSYFPQEILQLKELQTLNMGKNRLQNFKPDSLERPLDLSQLKNLKYLTLSDNSLVSLPEKFPVGLKTLVLNNNRLTDIPAQVLSLTCLEVLYLKGNHICKIPIELKHLKALTRLDLRENPISRLPAEVFKDKPDLPELRMLRIDTRRLEYPGSYVFDKIRDAHLVKTARSWFEQEALERSYMQLSKAIFLGSPGAGKSAMVDVLSGHDRAAQGKVLRETIGIEQTIISDKMDDNASDNCRKVLLWDMAGQKEYQATHQMFLNSSQHLHIIVFNVFELSKWSTEEQFESKVDVHLMFWINSVHNCVPNGEILLVASHIDKFAHGAGGLETTIGKVKTLLIEKATHEITALRNKIKDMTTLGETDRNTMAYVDLYKRLLPTKESWLTCLKGEDFIFKMSAIHCSDKLKAQLNARIFERCSSLKRLFKAPKHAAATVDILRDIKQPFVHKQEVFESLMASDSVPVSEMGDIKDDDIHRVLKFLNDCNEIVYFEETSLVFTNFAWIVGLLKQLVCHDKRGESGQVSYIDDSGKIDNTILTERWDKYLQHVGREEVDSVDPTKREAKMRILFQLMQQFKVLFPCQDPDKSWVLCNIPATTKYKLEAEEKTKRFEYPLKPDDMEVARIIEFGRKDQRGIYLGLVPEGLIHNIQATWMQRFADGSCKESDPYFADAVIMHVNKDVQIYLRSGYNRADRTGGVLEATEEENPTVIQNFLYVCVRFSADKLLQDQYFQNLHVLDQVLDDVMGIVRWILASTYPGLVYNESILCPTCVRVKARLCLVRTFDTFEIGGKGLYCKECKKTIPRHLLQRDLSADIVDYSSNNLRAFSFQSLSPCPKPAVVAIGVVDKTGFDGVYQFIYHGSGVCVDNEKGVFLTSAHNFLKVFNNGKYVGDQFVSPFEEMEIFIGLYQGDSQTAKWLFSANKDLIKEFVDRRTQQGTKDDIFVLLADKWFDDGTHTSFGNAPISMDDESNQEAVEKEVRQYRQGTPIKNIGAAQNADLVARKYGLSLGKITTIFDDAHMSGVLIDQFADTVDMVDRLADTVDELVVYGYSGPPMVGNEEDTCAFEDKEEGMSTEECGDKAKKSYDWRIVRRTCEIVENSDRELLYVTRMKLGNGSSGGPALWKSEGPDGTVYRVVGVFKGESTVTDESVIVPLKQDTVDMVQIAQERSKTIENIS